MPMGSLDYLGLGVLDRVSVSTAARGKVARRERSYSANGQEPFACLFAFHNAKARAEFGRQHVSRMGCQSRLAERT